MNKEACLLKVKKKRPEEEATGLDKMTAAGAMKKEFLSIKSPNSD